MSIISETDHSGNESEVDDIVQAAASLAIELLTPYLDQIKALQKDGDTLSILEGFFHFKAIAPDKMQITMGDTTGVFITAWTIHQ